MGFLVMILMAFSFIDTDLLRLLSCWDERKTGEGVDHGWGGGKRGQDGWTIDGT
jgi:hypothetical protein